jgi:tetratricopeptide (TPR) repeat protein
VEASPRATVAAPTHPDDKALFSAAIWVEPPDPAEFEESPVAQPIWLGAGAKQPFSPIDQTAFERPLNERTDTTYLRAPQESGIALSDEPDIISDLADTPESWLAEAGALACATATSEQLSEAVELCRLVISSNPPQKLATSARRLGAWALNRRGELLLDADQHQEAVVDFEAAIVLDNSCSAAIHNRAVVRAQQYDFEAALEDFNRVIELNPELAIAYRNRAELLAAQGKMNNAVDDYARAVNGMPNDAELYRARAHALQSLGEFERAIADLNRSIQLDPQAVEGLVQRGNIMAERGDFDHALADFQQAATLAPELAEVHRSLAWIYASCPEATYRDREKGLASAQLAVKLSTPDDYFALEALAAAQANAELFDNAVETQRQALHAAPAQSSEPIRQRLVLYEQRQPYRSRVLRSATVDQ